MELGNSIILSGRLWVWEFVTMIPRVGIMVGGEGPGGNGRLTNWRFGVRINIPIPSSLISPRLLRM
jgi:hypothetical protein